MRWLVFACAILTWSASAQALERVTLRRDEKDLQVDGRILVTADDGGLLLQSQDGAIWSIEVDEIQEHTSDEDAFVPLSTQQLAEQLRKEMPSGFDTYVTQHYVICFNTSRVYAQWCAGLFERLYRAFNNYWSRKGFEVHDPEFPLVALVFTDKESYGAYAEQELGEATPSIIGYYSLRTNRMTMYDLTGIEALRQPGDRRGSAAQITEMLARPDAERTVATVIHEATHQIAFNCGLQTRYADIPLWVSEGLAVYFETPDLKSAKGWRSMGSVNQVRLSGFRDYSTRRPAGSLETLVADDSRFRDAKLAADAYSEAWALNYFLLRQHPKEYHAYLKKLGEKSQLVWDEPETRLREFREAFGDLKKLDAEFVRQLAKVR